MSFDTAATIPARPAPVLFHVQRTRTKPTEGTLMASVKPPPRPGMPRPGNTTDERTAAIVRGVLLDRLDNVLGGHAARFAERFRMSRVQWLDLVQAVSAALFPEEFEADGRAEIEMAANRAAADAERARLAAQHALNESDRRECLDLARRMDAVAVQVRRGGLVPAGGRLERVGPDRLAVFAAALQRAAG